MNKYTVVPGIRKGVSPWVAIAVFTAVMALILAILPTTASTARADESDADQIYISDIADVLAESNLDVVEETDLPEDPFVDEVVEEQPADEAVEEQPVDEAVEEQPVDEAVEDEPSLVDAVMANLENALIAPMQVTPASGVSVNYGTIVSEPANSDGLSYVGDRVRIEGTWAVDTPGETLVKGQEFSLPFPVEIALITSPINLWDIQDPTKSWAECTVNNLDNGYDCVVGENVPTNKFNPSGTWWLNADARGAGTWDTITIQERTTGDLDLSKSGEQIGSGGLLGGEPGGTVFSYRLDISGSELNGRTEPLVIVDTYSDLLKSSDLFDVTVLDGFGPLDHTIVFDDANNTMTITITPVGSFTGDDIVIRYRLVTDSGGLDPAGTLYENTASILDNTGQPLVSAEDWVTQNYDGGGSGVGINRGSFELTKRIDEVPAGFDPVNSPFKIQVTEYAPGNYPGTPETTYSIDIHKDQTLTGWYARPADWTIVLSEDPTGGWEPQFTVNGANTGDTAVINTQSDSNVAVVLQNLIQPSIGTKAAVEGSVTKVLPVAGGKVTDTVSYTSLKPETEYTLKGRIMAVSATAAPFDTGIVASGTFTTPAAPAGEFRVSGEHDIVFDISAADAAKWAGSTLVVYEQLFETTGPNPDVPVAVHEDETDQDQTFTVAEGEPSIGTFAEVKDGADKKVMPLTGGTLVDTVSYKYLKPNTEYTLNGELMHVDGASGTPTGILGTATFTTPAGIDGQALVSGTTTVEFEITAEQAKQYGGQELVVFEVLLDAATGDEVASHEDVNDKGQTFEIEGVTPTLKTSAEVQGDDAKLLPITGGEVVDTVSYTDLRPETEYRLEGELMHVDGTAVTATGITASGTFTTPAAAAGEFYVSGTTTITFTISAADAEQYAGEKLVVFEVLFDVVTDEEIADHRDPEDEAQSFEIERKPEIGTRAEVQGGDAKLLPITGGEVVDTVSYTDLRPATEYRLEGELMHVDGTTVTATGITASGTFTTPAAAAGEKYVSGTTTITFTISAADAEKYAGEKLVVFEILFNVETGDEVADHRDPEDEDQSFEIEPGGDIIVEKVVTGPKGDQVENDEDAVFQIRAEWTDIQGNDHSRVFNVTPGQPVALSGLPLDTEITLTEIGADTSVSNVKWGDIIWSGEGVTDESGDSASGTVILGNAQETVRVNLENETSSNSLIIIPIPIPLIPGGGSSTPPSPTEPVAPHEPTEPQEPAAVEPAAPVQPGDKVAAKQPQPAPKGLAVTGADVMWIAGGGLSVLLLGAWLVLRGRRNES